MKGSIVGLLAATALVSGVSHAEGQSFDDRVYGGLLLNFVDADNDLRNINDSRDGVRALVGKRLSPMFAVEGTASYNEFDAFGSNIHQHQKEASLALEGLVYPFKCTGNVDPFVKAGIGGVYFNEDETALKLSVGAGLDWTVADNGLKVRTDVAWRYMNTDEPTGAPVFSPLGHNPTEWVVGAGLVLPFGDAPMVDEGCSKMMAKPAPATPAPEAPPETGVMDSDGDGVIDANDKCPNTPPGTKVDVNGCPVPETVVIYFAFDSSELNSAAKAALDRVAANLVNKNFVVAIANGHADSTGTEEYNMGLSERRANSVASYLASKGVDAGQIRQRAYGETRPAASGETEIGRAKNRRVEINLLRQ